MTTTDSFSARGLDVRDPRGLAADAPLLAAWLDWTRRVEAGEVAPMTTPGHKTRQDLVGAVIAGDAPLYGALDTIKLADRLRADAEARAADLWDAAGAGSRWPAPPTETRRCAWRSAGPARK